MELKHNQAIYVKKYKQSRAISRRGLLLHTKKKRKKGFYSWCWRHWIMFEYWFHFVYHVLWIATKNSIVFMWFHNFLVCKFSLDLPLKYCFCLFNNFCICLNSNQLTPVLLFSLLYLFLTGTRYPLHHQSMQEKYVFTQKSTVTSFCPFSFNSCKLVVFVWL